MEHDNNPIQTIFDAKRSFEERCTDIFRYQVEQNPFYRRFVQSLGMDTTSGISFYDIPLLPIRAFKHGAIITRGSEAEITFRSSGTSGMERSAHHVADLTIYRKAIADEFYRHFPPDRYSILCYMPGYDKNPDSSLTWMGHYLSHKDESGLSRFISADTLQRADCIKKIEQHGKKVLLFGAAFGLVDLAEAISTEMEEIEILETGGMKTNRREMTKQELRDILSKGFGIPPEAIHSEYGMCELLSQMYATGGEWFSTPHWVYVSIRDPEHPSRECDIGEEGKIGIIDLANVYSCPFILTDDRGLMDATGMFRVLGRWTQADPRGCNFLIDRD